MRVDAFVAERSSDWDELEVRVRSSVGRTSKRSAQDVQRTGELYRSAAGDLAVARRRWPQHSATARLEQLVRSARSVVYGSRRSNSLLQFVRRDYWRTVRERPAMLVLACVLMFGSAALGGLWGWKNPEQAARYLPSQYRAVAESNHFQHRNAPTADDETAMSGIIATNNIRVTFLAFAGGGLLGLLTIFLLLQNGMLLGVLSGLAIRSGNGQPFFELILPHGLLELSCIAVGSAAGFRVAWAIIAPGFERRSTVVKREAVRAVAMIVGTSAWLVVAALIESFVTPQRIGFGPALIVGLGVAVVYWTLVFVLGRRFAHDDASPEFEVDGPLFLARDDDQILAESFSLR